MDPFRRTRREKKKAHARAQRRYARTHREQINARNRQRYLGQKKVAARLRSIAELEAREKAELEVLLAELHREPPELTLRDVWGK